MEEKIKTEIPYKVGDWVRVNGRLAQITKEPTSDGMYSLYAYVKFQDGTRSDFVQLNHYIYGEWLIGDILEVGRPGQTRIIKIVGLPDEEHGYYLGSTVPERHVYDFHVASKLVRLKWIKPCFKEKEQENGKS